MNNIEIERNIGTQNCPIKIFVSISVTAYMTWIFTQVTYDNKVVFDDFNLEPENPAMVTY